MTIDVLVSSLNYRFADNPQLFRASPGVKYIVVNQITDQREHKLSDKFIRKDISIWHFREKGLSRSRNRAISLAAADICLLADDDLVYTENAFQDIRIAFLESSADLITFRKEYADPAVKKKYPSRALRHNRRTIMSVGSVEIAFRREKIPAHDLKFDQDFGPEADFPTGEENIFLLDALNRGLKISFVPANILTIISHDQNVNKFDIDTAWAKGAMFARMFGWNAFFCNFLFTLRKYSLYKGSINLREFFQAMNKGSREYLNHAGRTGL